MWKSRSKGRDAVAVAGGGRWDVGRGTWGRGRKGRIKARRNRKGPDVAEVCVIILFGEGIDAKSLGSTPEYEL